jgi:hypothetical protein
LLFVPFPQDIVEASGVELTLRDKQNQQPFAPTQLIYQKDGIHCVCTLAPQRTLVADVRFTALGRNRFEYSLPPARQMKSVEIALDLKGAKAITIPDDSLQPTTRDSDRLHWDIKNLVSDRRIKVLIPETMAPAARVLYLWRFVAVAVLLFGAGFLYLSEQSRPGQLDRFRLGHFVLLALTYSLFFVIFTVLEFQTEIGTVAAMLLSAAFSIPLLVLHVAGVLGFWFALTRVLPLALFSLGLVINGVYGAGGAQQFVVLGAVVLIVAYLTITFPAWAAKRERHRLQKEAEYAVARKALVEDISVNLFGRIAELKADVVQTENQLRTPTSAGATISTRARLELARASVPGLTREYDELATRLAMLPVREEWQQPDLIPTLRKAAEDLRERTESRLASLRAELDAARPPAQSRDGETHCAACGLLVPRAPFCQRCGAVQPVDVVCPGCGLVSTLPSHLIPGGVSGACELFCTRCGTGLTAQVRPPQVE